MKNKGKTCSECSEEARSKGLCASHYFKKRYQNEPSYKNRLLGYGHVNTRGLKWKDVTDYIEGASCCHNSLFFNPKC